MLEPWHQDTQENFIVAVQRISFGKRPPRSVKGPSSDQGNHPRVLQSYPPVCLVQIPPEQRGHQKWRRISSADTTI